MQLETGFLILILINAIGKAINPLKPTSEAFKLRVFALVTFIKNSYRYFSVEKGNRGGQYFEYFKLTPLMTMFHSQYGRSS